MPRHAPLLLGHRGAPRSRRENTIASYDAALEAGADGVELDVRACLDELVVHHDATLRRRGKRRRLADLERQRLPPWLPALSDVVAWARLRQVLVDVEVKEAGHEERILRACAPILSQSVFTSFLPDVVHRLRELEPRARVGWITKSEPDAVRAIAFELRPDLVVLPARRCGAALVEDLRRSGMEVWAWKVNTVDVAQRLTALGVACLITDEPRRLSRWRDASPPQQRVAGKGRRESSAPQAAEDAP